MTEREEIFVKAGKAMLGKDFDLAKFQIEHPKLLDTIYTAMAASFGKGVSEGYDLSTRDSLKVSLENRKN